MTFHDNRYTEELGRMNNRNKETAKFGSFPAVAAAGAGMSSTASFKKDSYLEVFGKTSTSACTDLLPLPVTMATWNQDESAMQSRGLP